MEEQWDLKSLDDVLRNEWQVDFSLVALLEAEPNITDEELLERLLKATDAVYDDKVGIVGKESFGGFERGVMLQGVDSHWREHLAALDHLRQGIHLRGYAQKNPKQEYKREAFELFGQMLNLIKDEVVKTVMTVRIQSREEIDAAEEKLSQSQVENVHYQHADFDPDAAPEELLAPTAQASDAGGHPQVNEVPKVGRNDPCPCGSGKKYKQCHGRLA
jgi:preprotein translocase subunit SecA